MKLARFFKICAIEELYNQFVLDKRSLPSKPSRRLLNGKLNGNLPRHLRGHWKMLSRMLQRKVATQTIPGKILAIS